MRHQLFEIPIDDVSDAELDRQLTEWLNGSEFKFITTPNPEFVLLSRRDESFRTILQSSDLSLPDGVGIRFAIAALSNDRLRTRHTGVDLIETLARLSSEFNRRVLLVGGAEDAAEKTKQHFEQKYPGINIFVFNPGRVEVEVKKSRSREVEKGNESIKWFDLVSNIETLKPVVLIVALGQGKQERFIEKVRDSIPSLRIAVGVGGAFEMIAGMKPRAPRFMSQMGLEWLWRVLIEPKRIGRILNASFVFPLIVISATLKQHRFLKACRNVVPEIMNQLFRS